MRHLVFALSLVGFALFGTGCCQSPQDIADSKTITVQEALADIGTGLHQLHVNAHQGEMPGSNGRPFGLSIDTVTVTFNVSASATNSNQLSLSLSADPPAVPGVGANVSGSVTNSSQAMRGNTITLTFKNPIFADSGTLVHDVAAPQSSKAATTTPPTTAKPGAPTSTTTSSGTPSATATATATATTGAGAGSDSAGTGKPTTPGNSEAGGAIASPEDPGKVLNGILNAIEEHQTPEAIKKPQ